MPAGHSGGGGGKGANRKLYRNAIQKQGISEPNIPAGIPVKATPITPTEHCLGGTPTPHPYLKRTTKI